MDSNLITNALESLREDFEDLIQNKILDESDFLSFLKDLNIPNSKEFDENINEFLKAGWISKDGEGGSRRPRFHPFRVYSAYIILKYKKFSDLVKNEISTVALLVNLAILLEPIYWPGITYSASCIDEETYRKTLSEYREKIFEIVKNFDEKEWREIHAKIRRDAEFLDENSEIYLLLRASNWNVRKNLKGKIGAALWLRHIAEVIRRAFEENHNVEWLEEDQSGGVWPVGFRARQYGFDRPLDEIQKSQSYFILNLGIFSGTVVRWYVEGDTEYYSIEYALQDRSGLGIELVNMYGNIKTGKNNVALRLENLLKEDKIHRRFSMISFDLDVEENKKFIRRQVNENNIVGYIVSQKPDFELSNFSVNELVEVAAKIDRKENYDAENLFRFDWSSVKSGSDFEKAYRKASLRGGSLKGEVWGRELAEHAFRYPKRNDNGEERPFIRAMRASYQAAKARYDFQEKTIGFDLEAFEQIAKSPT
jgi:hypothetical protein